MKTARPFPGLACLEISLEISKPGLGLQLVV